MKQSIKLTEERIKRAEKSVRDFQEEANYHKGAMESRYDTFKEEAQYMVDANKERLISLSAYLTRTKQLIEIIKNHDLTENVISLGKCFEIQRDQTIKHFFVVPFANIPNCTINNKQYILIGSSSPVYKIFKGLKVNDFSDDENGQFDA